MHYVKKKFFLIFKQPLRSLMPRAGPGPDYGDSCIEVNGRCMENQTLTQHISTITSDKEMAQEM